MLKIKHRLKKMLVRLLGNEKYHNYLRGFFTTRWQALDDLGEYSQTSAGSYHLRYSIYISHLVSSIQTGQARRLQSPRTHPDRTFWPAPQLH